MVGPMCLAKGIFNSWPLFFTHLIISTDPGTTSSTSESGLSTTSTQRFDYWMLREGGYEAPVISVDGEGLAGSGAGWRKYDQPAERRAHVRESASAQHLELLPSTRAARDDRNAPSPPRDPPLHRIRGPCSAGCTRKIPVTRWPPYVETSLAEDTHNLPARV